MRKCVFLLFFVFALNKVTAQLFPWCPFYHPIKRELSVVNTPQEGMSWCWLAAIQMSLDYNLCLRKSQCELNAKIFPNSVICCPVCCLDSAQCLTEQLVTNNIGDCTDVVTNFVTFIDKSIEVVKKTTNSNSVIVNSFQGIKNITTEFDNKNAVILINASSRNTKFLPTGLHAVIGAGIINKKGLDSFLIIQDPFAPCKGCKYWINIKCYNQPKVHYFTKFEKEALVIKDPNNTCACGKSVNTCLTNTEILALKILDSINIDLNSTICRYNMTKTEKAQYNKSGKLPSIGQILSYKNDFFIVLQNDSTKNEEVEVGFCPYVLEKTIEVVNELYKISLRESSGTLQATILSFENYPSDFYSFYITRNGTKERYLSPTINDFKLNLNVGKGYKFDDILKIFIND